MKKIFLLSLFGLFFTLPAHGQEAISIPDTLSGWDIEWQVGINGSQASYSNWAQGGVNNIAITGSSIFTTVYKKGRFSYGFRLNTRYGKTKVQSEGVRKIDDRISIRNRFLYDLEKDDVQDFKIFGNINFRTQFDKGFQYGAGPDGEDILISRFLAPAYFSQNFGLVYQPNENFSMEAGLGLQQTIVRDTSLAERYNLNEGESIRVEAGLTSAVGYSAGIATNLRYSSNLETFWGFEKPVESIDIIFTNMISGRINSVMNASVRLDLVYDDDFSKELQLAQVLSLGVSFILL